MSIRGLESPVTSPNGWNFSDKTVTVTTTGSYTITGTDVTVSPDGSVGTITLNVDFTIPTDAVLTIPPGWTLNLNGYTLTNSGGINNLGTITKNDGNISGTQPGGTVN